MAIPRVLKLTRQSLTDIGLIELNEAFAPACHGVKDVESVWEHSEKPKARMTHPPPLARWAKPPRCRESFHVPLVRAWRAVAVRVIG